VNKEHLNRLAFMSAEIALFAFVPVNATASLSSAEDTHDYIYPQLAADGITSDDAALPAAAARCSGQN
jgi:hypothetical protein